MKKRITTAICLLITALSFYVLPLLIKDTGSAMVLLLVLIPAICLVCALLCGWMEGFFWPYAVIVAVLFIPTMFLYYNSSAVVYILAYGVIALVGNLLGSLPARKR